MNILGLIMPFDYSAYFLKLVVLGPTDGPTDRRTDMGNYRAAIAAKNHTFKCKR